MTVPIESLFFDDGGPHILVTGRRPTPRGVKLQALLESGIAGLEQLDSNPFSPPAEIDDGLVPIEDLLYSGRAALDRAFEVRDAIRARGGLPRKDEVEEVFDLLDLAARDFAPAE